MIQNNCGEMEEEPKISDRMQYLIGAQISIVMVVAYLFVSGEFG